MFSLYKPNSKNGGCAFSFSVGATGKDRIACVYINAIHQFSWNEKTRTGSFAENMKNPEKNLSVKLNEFELGGFINAIEAYTDFKAFHTFEENKTTINFGPYTKKDGAKAFSLTVTKNSAAKFGIGIELSEAQVLKQFCIHALNKIFESRKINSAKRDE
jgi:hypothetical protein